MLDFTRYIAEYTQDFVGRDWVFGAIHEWLSKDNGPRSFLLTGEPGSGKTAIAGRLFELSNGVLPTHKGHASLSQRFLSAHHFCSARDSRWSNPYTFAESLAVQLAHRYPAYATALAEQSRGRDIKIEVEQRVRQNSGQVIGVQINKLEVSGLLAEDAFQRIVREPLEVLCREDPTAQLVVLIDALDESLAYEGKTNIVSLLSRQQHLPTQVRFILTSRPDPRVENAFLDAGWLNLSSEEFARSNHDDISHYIKKWLEDKNLTIPDIITKRAEGNFLYVVFLLASLAKGQYSKSALEKIPEGLDGLYYDSLARVVRLGKKDWLQVYAPVIGALSVAQESLTAAQLKVFASKSETTIGECLDDLQQFLEVVTWNRQGEEMDGYRLYHQSVIDYLRRPKLSTKIRAVRNTFYLPAVEQHQRIADYYFAINERPWRNWDTYGLRYIVTHLAEIIRVNKQHSLMERLVRLIVDRDFQKTHHTRLADLPALQRDLERTLECAVVDEDPRAILLIVEATLALVAYHRECQPAELFNMACNGELEAAELRLGLFHAEPEWCQVVLLIFAWLASSCTPDKARALRDRVAENLLTHASLHLLLARLNTQLDGMPVPALDLPIAPSPEVAREIAGRSSGMSALDRLVNEAAVRDSPLLVAYAAVNPEEGDILLRQYIAAHSANTYVIYRSRALWALLGAVLRHPKKEWVQTIVVELATAALRVDRVEFQQGLPLAISAAREAITGPDGVGRLDGATYSLIAEANQAHVADRGRWLGWQKRYLTISAEIFFHLLNRQEEAAQLLARVFSVPYALAGFEAPACLTWAEASRVCLPDDHKTIDRALQAALTAAHHVQDAVFCAQTTARVNAMLRRWWFPASFDVTAVIPHFCTDPYAPEFASMHIVGEEYKFRSQGSNNLAIPQWMRMANSLEALAQVYQCPLSELQRLNPALGSRTNEPLPLGSPVNVPDAEFAAILAARLSAEVLITSLLSKKEQVKLLQSLVPIAATNVTALDTVLCRLLLATHPEDAVVMDSLARLIIHYGGSE